MDISIPDKMYFKIGEVAEIAGVKPHVLRYWESEFKLFRPGKSRTQQRLYQRKDIELVLRIKDLLYVQGFTIAGAVKKLREKKSDAPPQREDSPQDILDQVYQDLLRLKKNLS